MNKTNTNPLTNIRLAKTALAKAYLTVQNDAGQVQTELLCIEAKEFIDKAIAELRKR